jgi:hypothetical protein
MRWNVVFLTNSIMASCREHYLCSTTIFSPLVAPLRCMPLERNHDTFARYLETPIGVRDGTYDAFLTTTTSTHSVPCSSNPTRLAAASERSMMRHFPAP